MKWIPLALTVLILGAAAHTAAQQPPQAQSQQELYLRIPTDVPSKNPLEGDPDAIKAGMGAYRVRCADCHGMDARGIRGPDITQVWGRGRTDDALFSTIRNGVPNTEMPAHPAPRTSDMDIWRILAYLKTIATPITDTPRGNGVAGTRVFETNCMACHRVNGRGGRLGPDLSRIGVARTRAHMTRQIRGEVPDFRTGYEPVMLTTPGGQQIQGVKKNEDLFSVQIMDTRERIQGYLREDLKGVANAKISAMPTFGRDKLSDADLDDLLAYLAALQGVEPQPANENR
ncbi:MAG: c-type cytochrome [Acidobacteria bacterium]|nr:c-type cytochrome [Acidobacteriota bacterium]